MRLILVVTAFFVSCVAFADPYLFIGDYAFTGVVQPIGRVTVDVIDARMPDADQQVQMIKDHGGNCQRVAGSAIRCTTMNHASAVPQSSLTKIHDRNVGLQVTFGAPTSPPATITRGSTVDWQISQPVQWSGGSGDSFVYREMPGGISKLILPGTPESLTLNTTDGKTLNKLESFVVSESRWRWHEDMANVVLTLNTKH